MKRRFTIAELDSMTDTDILRILINERLSGLSNPYSPLSTRLYRMLSKLPDVAGLLALAKMFEAHVMGHKVGKDGEPFTPDELLSFIKDHIYRVQGR